MDSSAGGHLFALAGQELALLETRGSGPYGMLKAAGERDRVWLTPGGDVIVEQLLPCATGPGDTWQRTDCTAAFLRALAAVPAL